MTPNEIATDVSGMSAGMGSVAMASYTDTYTSSWSGGQMVQHRDDCNQWDR